MLADEIAVLVSYNNWANGRLLKVAKAVSPTALSSGNLSHGSAFETLRSMVDAEWSWRLACNGELAGKIGIKVTAPYLWDVESLEELAGVAAYWIAEGERLLSYVQALSESELDQEVIPSWSGRSVQRKHILFHILHHATNHRSELGWCFTAQGHSPGDLEFLDFLSDRG